LAQGTAHAFYRYQTLLEQWRPGLLFDLGICIAGFTISSLALKVNNINEAQSQNIIDPSL